MNKIELIQQAKKRQVKIGIDGGTKTGVAIRAEGDILVLRTLNFWSTYELITDKYAPDNVAIYVEDPSKNKPVFHKKQGRKQRLKIAQNVGGVKRETELLMDGLKRAGYLIVPVRPKHKKWSHDLFCKVTGWPTSSSTNEHQRDAARLILKR